jgi:hypothetical protein
MLSMADSSFSDIGEQGHGGMAMDECVMVQEIYREEEIVPNELP